MSTCTEFAVFEVEETNLTRVIALSESLFIEINAEQDNIIAHEILVKTDNAEEICWHLTWANVEAVDPEPARLDDGVHLGEHLAQAADGLDRAVGAEPVD